MSNHTTPRIALAGQPNCGKSTLFNVLTGANQRVANWPGVTVDKLSGWTRVAGKKVEIIDLPGTYSLTSSSPEERVTRGYLLHDKPDLVVNVIDASNLRQGLSLTLQLLEMGLPLIVNLNMMDAAEKAGILIDITALERLLQVPVIPSTMHRSQGKQALLQAIAGRLQGQPHQTPCRIDYGAMESYLKEMETRLSGHITGSASLPLRWASVKLLEGDDQVRTQLRETVDNAAYLIGFADELR
ncbi:MAG: FeoB small GTPase domain-containing protein, partial [Desulfuromonadaceae bacterium]|nr:FeoB small GTPase domain-containing protein [Desulfuromonadaceae bacterium]